MINCFFEDGQKAINGLRHVVLHALLEKDSKILLIKRADHILAGGKWGLPGGFLDRDETIEQGILREVKEETGWFGEIISLFRINSKPDRPGDDKRENVAIEFLVKPIKIVGEADSESSKVEWIEIDKIRSNEMAFDHEETIQLYLQHRQNPFKLPVCS